jgi:hypothetical protein
MGALVGYGVEFDTYTNTECGDPPNNNAHVAVDSLEVTCPVTKHPQTLSSIVVANLADGQWHQASIVLAKNGTVSVNLDQALLINSFQIPGWQNAEYRFGFTAATGADSNKHEVKGIQIAFAEPVCF